MTLKFLKPIVKVRIATEDDILSIYKYNAFNGSQIIVIYVSDANTACVHYKSSIQTRKSNVCIDQLDLELIQNRL